MFDFIFACFVWILYIIELLVDECVWYVHNLHEVGIKPFVLLSTVLQKNNSKLSM